MTDQAKIFVYGSLKRGFANASFLEGQRFLGTALSAPLYGMFDCGGFPGIVSREAGGAGGGKGVSIAGEIWEVDAECLRRLDDLEGIDRREYRRESIVFPPGNGEEGPVAAYFWEGGIRGLREITAGTWTREDEERRKMSQSQTGKGPDAR